MNLRRWDQRRLRSWGLCAVGVASLGWIGRTPLLGQAPAPQKAEAEQPSNERMPYDPDLARQTVAFWEAGARRDPQGAIALRELAGAYLARQRESGDIADAVRAEDAARRSIKILRRGNNVAGIRLARAFLAQHRFPEALEIALAAAATDPQAMRLVADIQLELGDYDAALRALGPAPSESEDLNYKALRARFEDIDGNPDRALRLMREAARITDDRPDMPAEAVAWYHTMVGHMLIDSGKLEEGERACRRALEIFPRDYRAMTGMAEAATWRGDHDNAIAWARKAIGIAPQNPEALRLIGDAYAAQKKPAEAEEQYRLLETLAHSFPRIYDRHWALFCADNDRNLDEALALARKDLELRRDIHAYDTLAWVCFKKGLIAEAGRLIEQAQSRGTQDASLYHHAGMIARAAGDKGRAETLLARARTLNPYLAIAPEATSKGTSRD